MEHFSAMFAKTDVEPTLTAGIFRREKVPIEAVEEYMKERSKETR